MSLLYLDTNIFLRFLTNDDAYQSPRAYTLFKEVEQGTRVVTTLEMVIAEIVHVLSSERLYNLSRQAIRDKLIDVLSLQGLRVTNKQALKTAADFYATTKLDFVDCYLLALAERRKETRIVSFDRGYDRIAPGIRVEP